MGLVRLIASTVALTVAILAIAALAAGAGTHTYAVHLTIEADKATGKINGTVVTDAPSEFCESSTIRVRKIMRGKDDVVARVKPYGGEWHLKATPAIHGERVYAEVSSYHLPSRPVVCLAARSAAVTAP